MRVRVDSIESTVRPLTFLSRALELVLAHAVVLHAAQLVPDHVHRLAHIVGPRAHVDRHLAGVDVVARVGEDVSESTLLAHLLEQARRGRPPEDRVGARAGAARLRAGSPGPRDRGGTAPSPSGGTAGTEPMPLGEEATAGAPPVPGKAPSTRPTIRSCSRLPAAATTMLPGMAPVVPLRDLRHRHRGHHFGTADDRPPEGVVTEHGAGQDVVHLSWGSSSCSAISSITTWRSESMSG